MLKGNEIIKKVPLWLESYKSISDRKNGVYMGGIVPPKYTDELVVDIYNDYLFDFKIDDFVKTGRYVVEVAGSVRALCELGKFFVNFSHYKCKEKCFCEIVESIANSDIKVASRIIVYRESLAKRLWSIVSCKDLKSKLIGRHLIKNSEKQIEKVTLNLVSYKSGKDVKTGIPLGGMDDPKYLNELVIDVQINDDDQPIDVFISGTKRAMKEWGAYLINFALYKFMCDDYHTHYDGIRGYNFNKTVNLIIRKS